MHRGVRGGGESADKYLHSGLRRIRNDWKKNNETKKNLRQVRYEISRDLFYYEII